MKSSESISLKRIILFAGASCAWYIGSGWATGQEVMQFFSSFGLISVWAAIISLVLFAFTGTALMSYGYEMRSVQNLNAYEYYCGNVLGKIFDWFIVVFLFSVVVVMISGTGAVFTEYYHISHYIGSAIMTVIVFISVMGGLQKTIGIIGRMGPIMIILAIIIGTISILSNPIGLGNADQVLATIKVPRAASSWWMAGILYAAYPISLSLTFFTTMGSTAGSRKEAFIGGLAGAIAYMAALLLLNLGILANIGEVYDKAVPTLALADKITPVIGAVFSVVLIGEIFSTAAPMLLLVCSRIRKEGTKEYKILAVVLSIVAFFIGLLPFGKLVGTVYPFTGYMGIILIIAIVYKEIIARKNRNSKEEKAVSAE